MLELFGSLYPFTIDDLQTVISYDGSNNVTYLCRSKPGKALSDPAWQIRKMTYDVSNNCTVIQFANGSNEYNLPATNLTIIAAYTYSLAAPA